VGADPLVDLAAALADLSGRTAGETAALLELNPERAGELAGQAAVRDAPPGAHTEPPVLVVDQFERLFTVSERGEEGRARREAFARALHALTTVPAGARRAPAVVVAALRADYLDRALELPVVAEAFTANNTFVIEAMTRAELREAVRGPADAVGVPVEPRLVEAVLQDAYGPSGGPRPGAGVLPLVSQAMNSAWRLRRGRTLTLHAYQRAGRLTQAVDRSAERAYRSLDGAGRGAARAMFLLLTRIAEDGRAVRRTASRTELYAGAGVSTHAGDAVLEAFATERLLVLGGEDVEICHDVLLDAWAMLHTWLEGDPEARARYGELLSDADTWRDTVGRRRSDHLYRAAQLEAVQRAEPRWRTEAARYPVPPHARGFLTASRRAVRRARRTRTAVVAALAALTLAAVVTSGTAVVDTQHARALQAVALSRQLAAASLAPDESPFVARQLAVAAWAVSPTQQAADAMQSLLSEQQSNGLLIDGLGPVTSVAFNPSGTLLASAESYGIVKLWNPATGREVGTPINADTEDQVPNEAPDVAGVAFNPSGTLLASADRDGTVKLWNPATGREVGTPITTDYSISSVAFNPSGTSLVYAVSGLDGGTIWQWPTDFTVAPYASLCAEVGAPYYSTWQQYASGEPQPDICG
jgi:hypothetical protein